VDDQAPNEVEGYAVRPAALSHLNQMAVALAVPSGRWKSFRGPQTIHLSMDAASMSSE
jgi:hypothetical protein